MIFALASAIAQAVQEAAVDRRALADVRLALEARRRLHGAHDRQVEDLGELPVPLVLAGHRHDRAGAVAGQHVVGDEDRDLRAVDRVGGERADEDAGLLLGVGLPLDVGLRRRRAAGTPRPPAPATGTRRSTAPSCRPATASATSASTSSCSGASTMYVAPKTVSGRVVNTRIGPASVGKSMCAPVDRPIQLRCMALTFSGQSSVSRSSSSRSPYAVMRIIHCRRLRLNTGKLPRSLRPSGVTSSLASTVPSPGHQLTGASDTYARRWSSTIVPPARPRPVTTRPRRSAWPAPRTRTPRSVRRSAAPCPRAGSNQELKICRKIHWVQR